MTDWIMWFAVAGLVVIFEIFTGTFYLLMIGVGLAAGGIAALAGVGGLAQTLIAGVVAAVATYGLRRSKLGTPHKTDAARDPNVNLDIGQTLVIKEWNNGTARAMYRGAMWDVELAHGAHAQPGVFIIKEIRGSRLIVANTPSKQ